MRIDEALTSDLGLGSKKRTLDANDSHIDIPSAIMPVAPILKPVGGPLSTPNESSIGVNYLAQKNNTGAFSELVTTLAAGLWEIQFNGAHNFVIGTALTANQVILLFMTQNANPTLTIPLFSLFLQSESGQFVWNVHWKFLIREAFDLKVSGPATAVGDTVFINWNFLINKLI